MQGLFSSSRFLQCAKSTPILACLPRRSSLIPLLLGAAKAARTNKRSANLNLRVCPTVDPSDLISNTFCVIIREKHGGYRCPLIAQIILRLWIPEIGFLAANISYAIPSQGPLLFPASSASFGHSIKLTRIPDKSTPPARFSLPCGTPGTTLTACEVARKWSQDKLLDLAKRLRNRFTGHFEAMTHGLTPRFVHLPRSQLSVAFSWRIPMVTHKIKASAATARSMRGNDRLAADNMSTTMQITAEAATSLCTSSQLIGFNHPLMSSTEEEHGGVSHARR
ncbi:hypothetical protein L596_022455 [Steinernema carpocapsae]|uniref:Uncharacterized protein n=1 Tax=Steinernema carpocapsae TaxID=34508 RepID=A0A4U5MLU5_STECR|nr:hypothetical protein L596_022455 [Steinernema carpocapsae]